MHLHVCTCIYTRAHCVCTYVCAYTHMYVYIYTCVHIYTHIRTDRHIHAYTYIHIYIYKCVHMHMHTYIHKCMIYIHMHAYAHMQKCTYTCAYTHMRARVHNAHTRTYMWTYHLHSHIDTNTFKHTNTPHTRVCAQPAPGPLHTRGCGLQFLPGLFYLGVCWRREGGEPLTPQLSAHSTRSNPRSPA